MFVFLIYSESLKTYKLINGSMLALVLCETLWLSHGWSTIYFAKSYYVYLVKVLIINITSIFILNTALHTALHTAPSATLKVI